MRGLGFGAYVAQGGDIGSYVSRLLGEKHGACKGGCGGRMTDDG